MTSLQGHISAKAKSRRRRCIRRYLTVTCASLAVLCVVIGACVTTLFDYLFQEQLKVLMPLANGSMSYRGWSSPPNEISFQIWLWNITNPTEIVRGERPILRHVGPFTFAEKRHKANITFYENDTVSFVEYQQFIYKPEKSVGNISELIITSINMPYAVTCFRTRQESIYARNMAYAYLKKSSGGLFVTRTAKEILLGYTDRALKSVQGFMRRFFPKIPFQTETGLFINTNNTHKGVFLVHTGRGNLSNFNRVQRWNGNSSISVWPTPEANKIVGTDGSMFGPGITPNSRLNIFSIDICRSLSMVYSERADVNGIPALRFVPSSEIMENATLRPENRAFCSSDGFCLDSGVLNISLCRDGIPLVISGPHFTGAPAYQTAVLGMEPSDADYGTKIDVEPLTGFVIGAQRRMQMNLILQRTPGFQDTERLVDPILIMPLMWLNQSAQIDPYSATMFKAHLLAPIHIVGYAQWVLIAVGIVWMAGTAAVCSLLAHRRHKQQRQRIVRSLPADEAVVFKPRSRPGSDYQVQVDESLIRKLQDTSLPETDLF